MVDERANARAADGGNSRKEWWHNSFCHAESRSVIQPLLKPAVHWKWMCCAEGLKSRPGQPAFPSTDRLQHWLTGVQTVRMTHGPIGTA
jgi:hypothetical protein